MLVNKKKYTLFRPIIRSRHPSHDSLRKVNKTLPLLPFKSIIRFGSNTELVKNNNRIELNSVKAIQNSANKLLMKTCFTNNNIKTADWYLINKNDFIARSQTRDDITELILDDLSYPIISKNIYGSRGTGNKKHDSKEELEAWMQDKNLDNYIFEKFYNYTREYRLHVTKNGCFYACRKMLKSDTPQEHKWYRNDKHCVWIMEENELFDRPVNWEEIVQESVKALRSIGLDFGAIDLKIQSATNKKGQKRKNPEFIIIEINSAPSFGDVTTQKYIEELPKLLIQKNEETKN